LIASETEFIAQIFRTANYTCILKISIRRKAKMFVATLLFILSGHDWRKKDSAAAGGK
jgi:hypothetical protein